MTWHARLSIASLALGVSLVLARPSHAQVRYTAVDLGGLPGAVATHAADVNDRGEVIGMSEFNHAIAWTRDGIVELGGLLASETDTVARSINKRGDVVGDSLFSRSTWPFQRHGFVWRDGVMTDLGTLPGKADSYAVAINDHGEIAGTAYTIGFGSNLVLWRDGAIHDLGAVRASSAWVTGMNNRRQIIGYATFGSFARAFVWADGVLTYLTPLDETVSGFPWSINDRGEIAGAIRTGDGTQHAALWRNGELIDLGQLPGARYTAATGINDHGQVVGFATDADNTIRAFVWEDGRFLELEPLPGSAWASASAINDHGEIVGFGPDATGTRHRGIMWIPVKGGGQ